MPDMRAIAVLISMMMCLHGLATPFAQGPEHEGPGAQDGPREGSRSTFWDGATTLILENAFVSLKFEKASNGGLGSIYDPVNGAELRPDKDMVPTLFRVHLRNSTGDHFLSSSDAGGFSYAGANHTNGSSLAFGHTAVGGLALNVTASVEISDLDTRTFWTISVENHEPSTAVVGVMFPLIWGVPSDIGSNGRDDLLAVPRLDGTVYKDPYGMTQAPHWRSHSFLYPGTMSMQFMALYDPLTSGIHLETRDMDGHPKMFVMENQGPAGNVLLGIEHLGPDTNASDLVVPYPSVISFFKGTWYTAADVYKEWALEQAWTSKGQVQERQDIPGWWEGPSPVVLIEDHDIGGGQVTPVETWSDLVSRYNGRTGANITLFVRGWEANGTYTGPYVLPPKDGEDTIKDEVKEALVSGGAVMFSMSGRLWRLKVDASGYDAGATFNSVGWDHAILDQTGQAVVDTASEALAMPGAAMDTSSAWWQDMVASTTGGISSLHVDGILIEDLPVDAWVPCYNEDHGHEMGWGSYITDGILDTVQGSYISAMTMNPNALLATDQPSELLLGLSQAYISSDNAPELSVHYIDDIHDLGDDVLFEPMFTYVYHPYTTTFGTPVDIDAFSGLAMFNSSARAIARDLVRGKHPSVWINGTTSADDLTLMELLKRSTEAITGYARDHLYLGVMLEPPVVHSPMVEIPYDDPFHDDVDMGTTRDSLVLNSAWRAPDGTIGHVLVNWGNSSVDVSLPVPDQLGIGDNVTLVVTRNGEPLTVEPSTALPTEVTLTMGPRDVVLLEVMTAPDIVVEALVPTPSDPVKGQEVTLNVSVANRGSLAVHQVNVFLYEDGIYLDNHTISTLGPDGNETVEFHWPTEGRHPGQYNLTARVWPRAQEIFVDNNELTVQVEVLPIPVGNVLCTVIDNGTGAPLSGAEVLLFHPSNGTVIDLKVTNPSTDTVFQGLLPGIYGINVTRNDFLPAEDTDITVTAHNTTVVTMALDPEPVIETHGSISGQVLDANTSAPLSGATVHLVEANMTYYTSIDGQFLFGEVEVGNHTVRVTRNEYRPLVMTVTVTGGETTHIDIMMEWLQPPPQRGDIVGVVLDVESETPITGAIVKLVEEDILTLTNDTGGFIFASILLGSYSINVTAQQYQGTDVNVDVLLEGTNIVTIHLEPVRPPLPPKVIIRGFVMDKKDRPVPAATVDLAWPDGRRATSTDEAGYYTFPGLTPTEFTMTVSAPGYENGTYRFSTGQGTHWQNVTLEGQTTEVEDEDNTVMYVLLVLNVLMIMGIVIMLLTGRKVPGPKKVPKRKVRTRKRAIKAPIEEVDEQDDEAIRDDEE